MAIGGWRWLQWLPVVAVAGYVLQPLRGNVDQLTIFWLWLFALSFARFRLPLRTTLLAGIALGLAATMLVVPPVAALLVALVGGGGALLGDYWYGARQAGVRAVAQTLRCLLPYGLFRSLSTGPWPPGAGLAVALLGGALALGAAVRALRSPDPRAAQGTALFGAALGSVGLLAPLAVIATSWTLLLVALVSPEASALLLVPLPWIATFVAWWLLVAAAAGSQNWVLVGVFVLAALCTGVASIRATAQMRPRGRDGAVLFMLGLGGLLSGVVVKQLLPLADQLAIGLTQLGIVETWPWIGSGGLNAAHQRVMVLPVVVWGAASLVLLAVSLLLAPLRQQPVHISRPVNDEHLWQMVEQRVWWLGRG